MKIFARAEHSLPFELFGFDHLATLVVIAVACILIPLIDRVRVGRGLKPALPALMAASLLLGEAVKIGELIVLFDYRPLEVLPLQLCGISSIAAAIMLFTRSERVFEIVYFWVLAGGSQALLTPDLRVTFPNIQFLMFFFTHGLAFVAVAYGLMVFRFRLTRMSLLRAVIVTQVYAILIFPLNFLLESNYLYIRHKPAGASLLDKLGDWPWYLIPLELIAAAVLCVFFLIYVAADRTIALIAPREENAAAGSAPPADS